MDNYMSFISTYHRLILIYHHSIRPTNFNPLVRSRPFWLLKHPGQTVSTYDLSVICLQDFDGVDRYANIKSDFGCTSIVPFDKPIFNEEELLLCYMSVLVNIVKIGKEIMHLHKSSGSHNKLELVMPVNSGN